MVVYSLFDDGFYMDNCGNSSLKPMSAGGSLASSSVCSKTLMATLAESTQLLQLVKAALPLALVAPAHLYASRLTGEGNTAPKMDTFT